MKCLIIEDSKLDAEIMLNHIKKNRPYAKLTVCNRFIDGAKALHNDAYDVIFLDLNLPDNWGISSVRDIKKYAHLAPIIVTTGFTSKTTIEEAKNAGAALVFKKRDITSETIAGLMGSQEMVG